MVVRANKSSYEIFSPSKINVFLRIVRRRPDGFHDLASLFHVIDLGDTLTFEPLASTATKDEFTCSMKGVPTDSSNLVLRAMDLYRAKTGERKQMIFLSTSFFFSTTHVGARHVNHNNNFSFFLCSLFYSSIFSPPFSPAQVTKPTTKCTWKRWYPSAVVSVEGVGTVPLHSSR